MKTVSQQSSSFSGERRSRKADEYLTLEIRAAFQRVDFSSHIPQQCKRATVTARSFQAVALPVLLPAAPFRGFGQHTVAVFTCISLMATHGSAPARTPPLLCCSLSNFSQVSEHAMFLLIPGPRSQFSSHNLESFPHPLLLALLIAFPVSTWIPLASGSFPRPPCFQKRKT